MSDRYTSLPPFPSDVLTAPLHAVSLADLVHHGHDSTASNALFEACRSLGFFYLDLRGGAEDLTRAVDCLFAGMDEFPAMSDDERLELTSDEVVYGLKSHRKKAAGMRAEIFNVLVDDVQCKVSQKRRPNALRSEERAEALRVFVKSSYDLVALIVSHLERHLNVANGTLLDRSIPKDTNAHSHVSFTFTPPVDGTERQVPFNMHTDYGTVTMVHHRILGGLQVLLPESADQAARWAYVPPREGHCVVNLGDAMHIFSGGTLRSNIHRVVDAPGEQARHARYSLVYFSTPDDDVLLNSVVGNEKVANGGMTYKEFHEGRLSKKNLERSIPPSGDGAIADSRSIGDVFGDRHLETVRTSWSAT